MKMRTLALAAVAAVAAGLVAAPALATETPTPAETPRTSCPGVTGWRVNPDEGGLKPLLDEKGVHFTLANNNGKGLLKRDIDPVKIVELPALTMSVNVKTGVAPLIKAETSNPYSTINFLSDGTMWRTGLSTGPGSQSAPVADRGTLATLAGDTAAKDYTAATRVVTVGFGYANDTGNAATVTKFSMGHKTWSLKCKPEPTPTATPTATPTTPPATAEPTGEPTDGPTGAPGPGDKPRLPQTGFNAGDAAKLGGGVLLLGAVLAVWATWYNRRRRPSFKA